MVYREIDVMSYDNNNWKIPFNVALGLHILLVITVIYLPQFLNKKPLFPDIYTIDLVNISEPAFDNTDSQPPPPPPPKTDVNKKNAVSISDKPAPVKIKPVSIKPLKRKIVKKKVAPKKKLEDVHKRNLKEVREAERLAEEAARLAAAEAVNQLKQMLLETSSVETPINNKPVKDVQQSSNRPKSNAIEAQYYASIFNRLQPFWSLPEYKNWSPDLIAIIVVQINKNGQIISHSFERESGDRLFDQLVVKTLQDGAPLPPIPGALQKNRLEIGLRFRPGSIQ